MASRITIYIDDNFMLENYSIVLDCGSHNFRWSHLVIEARGECGKRILPKVVSMAVEGGLSGAMGGASGPSVCCQVWRQSFVFSSAQSLFALQNQ